MRAIYTQFSGLAGLLALLNQLWSYAPLERTILIGFGTGLGVYLVLLLGDIMINRILSHTPPALARENSGESRNDSSEKTDAKAA
ncbi:MAG: hypothetical protein WED81_05830 [Rhodothermales bacterium]